MVTRAGEAAIEALIGPRDVWEKYEVIVRAIEHINSVTIEELTITFDSELS